jgi:NAD(P)-dependent dehydrogenase (short-subunit alcohol dehydrogenase family)
MTPDDWDSMMWSHARHTFVVARHAAAHWVDEYRAGRLNGGRLVTMCAATGLVGRPDLGSNHAAAKGAVAGFTLELAHELYPIGVTVNGVAAANVRGRMADYVNAYVPDVQEDHDPGDPRHAARVLAYLCTEDAGWLTGQVLRVMGGLLGRYQPWQLAESLTRDADWTLRDLRLGVRRLFGAYPEYRPMDGPHRAG